MVIPNIILCQACEMASGTDLQNADEGVCCSHLKFR